MLTGPVKDTELGVGGGGTHYPKKSNNQDFSKTSIANELKISVET